MEQVALAARLCRPRTTRTNRVLPLLAPLALLLRLDGATTAAVRGWRQIPDPTNVEVPNVDVDVDVPNAETLAQDQVEDPPSPCSCDCCQVTDRLPSEVEIKSTPNGSTIEIEQKCIRMAIPSEDNAQSSCGNSCQPSNNDLVLTASLGPLEYDRYCLYKCKPFSKSAGTSCMRLPLAETEAQGVSDGNGRVAGFMGPGGEGYGNEVAAAVPLPAAGFEEEAEAEANKIEQDAVAKVAGNRKDQEVTFDLRKLVAERLRAEAGAASAHGAATSERVRSNAYHVKRNGELMSKIQAALTPTSSALEKALGGADANATAADNAIAETTKSLNAGKSVAPTLTANVKQLTTDLVQKEALEAVNAEAKAYASRMGWDKPDFYGEVLANRAADPYMTAMVTAVTRTAEYNAYAKSLLGQARAVQSKAQDMTSQANAMGAQGDRIGSTIERGRAKTLLSSARDLESQANQMWKTADDARKTVPEWQNAAGKASAYTAWKWSEAIKPPPS